MGGWVCGVSLTCPFLPDGESARGCCRNSHRPHRGTGGVIGIIFVNIYIIDQGVNCGVGDDDYNIMMVLLKKRVISTLKTWRARHNSDN